MPDDATPQNAKNAPADSGVTPTVIDTPSPIDAVDAPPVSIPTPLPAIDAPAAPPDPPIAPPPLPSPPQSETPDAILPRPVSYPPAGWIQRAVAYLIDQVIVTLLYLIWLTVGLVGAGGSGNLRVLMKTVASPAFSAGALWGGLVIFVGYFTFFHAYGGQTPGKMVIRLKVVTADGGDLSILRSFCRALGYFVSSFFFGAGFLLALVPPRKRALHDLLTYSHVVLDVPDTTRPAADNGPHRPIA